LKEEQDDLAIGTGLERKARWISAKGGQASSSKPAAGNAANAVVTATTQATKVSGIEQIVHWMYLHRILPGFGTSSQNFPECERPSS